MRIKSILIVLLISTPALCRDFYGRLADAIYTAEGGSVTRWPYGIRLHLKNPRAECIHICKNAMIDWRIDGCRGDYISYLSNIYCPEQDDPMGHRNWSRNVHILMHEKY